MENKPTIRPINDACTVKNASLFFNYDTNKYHLVHYDTEILRIYKPFDPRIPLNVEIALKCSNSSTRAIMQVLDFLGIDRNSVQLKPFSKFVKYNMSTSVRYNKNQLREVIEQWQNTK